MTEAETLVVNAARVFVVCAIAQLRSASIGAAQELIDAVRALDEEEEEEEEIEPPDPKKYGVFLVTSLREIRSADLPEEYNSSEEAQAAIDRRVAQVPGLKYTIKPL